MKLISHILSILIFVQSFAIFPLEAIASCHKKEEKSFCQVKNEKQSSSKELSKHKCCSPKDKTSDSKDNCCDGKICKCNHSHHFHNLSLISNFNIHILSKNVFTVLKNEKISSKHLHGFDYQSTILQPPRF